ncbi:ABC transporter permease [Roseibium aestuarii]|uniref:ABC transporter permease n=1 Tax=Roseibium aestuarii TaxID=2600299 RepID=A0ABW4K1M0_9HYPH|nr:ABC transporter permease subunit [Roseibium aestuarii]
MLGRILTVAALELRIGMRNRWIVLATFILAGFSLALALLGSAPAGPLGIDRMTVTVASLASLSVYLVPLIALLLAFDAVAGEIDRGTLLLLLSSPLSRAEFLLGKCVGHFCVLSLSLGIGYGLTAALLWSSGEGEMAGLLDFARLIGTSTLLGLAFLAIGYVLSASVRQASTAAALAIVAWLALVVLYDLALLGLLVSGAVDSLSPSVFPVALLLNPADAFRLFNLAALGASDLVGGMAGVADSLPFAPELALASILSVAAATLCLAVLMVRRIVP